MRQFYPNYPQINEVGRSDHMIISKQATHLKTKLALKWASRVITVSSCLLLSTI